MKFNFIVMLTVAVIAFGSQSCKKDSGTGANNVHSTSTPLLVGLYSIDTTLVAPGDTLGKVIIVYDAQNRISLMRESGVKANGDSISSELFNYYYLGNDTFAYKVVETARAFYSSPVTTDVYTYYYTFLNGQMVSDSSYNPRDGYFVENRTYYPGYIKIASRAAGGFSGGVSNNVQNVHQTKSGDNIVYQIDTTYSLLPGVNQYKNFEGNTSYEPNPNPFYKVAQPRYFGLMEDLTGDFSAYDAPKNLILEQTTTTQYWSAAGLVNSTSSYIRYTYTFRPDGYPSEARYVYNNNGPGIIAGPKIVFVYK